MRLVAVLAVLLVIAAGILGPQFLFVVDETKMAIVTRFGEPRKSITEPGLYTRTAFIDKVTYFDKRSAIFDAPPDRLLTEDKKNLVIDVYAIGRIVEPLLFFKTVRTAQGAATRGTDIVTSDLRKEIANDEQLEIIKTSREAIMNRVKDTATPKLREFGIEIVDVRMSRADFPDSIAQSIYARMDAERKRIADRERGAGAQRDAEIRADVDKQATIIRAEADRDANITRGKGEAEAIAIFADALEQEPEFYSFQRSLEAYKTFLTKNTTVVLPADTDLFRFLQSPKGAANSSTGAANTSATISELAAVESAARQLLSTKLGGGGETPLLVKIERVQWNDSSLGCPEPGKVYAQAVVAGFRLVFKHRGVVLEVHSNGDGSLVLACAS